VIIGGRAHSIEEAEFIAQAGFPFAEISIRNAEEFLSQLDSFRDIKDTYNIFYLGHGPEEENPWDPDEQRRRFLPLLQKLLDCAAQLAIEVFTIHFWIDGRFVNRDIVAEKLKILYDMCCHAEQRGITLCIENLSETCTDFTSAFDAITNLGMTLDIGHGELLTEKNTAFDFTQNCFSRIHHLHVHDNRGGDTPEDDLHLPLGEGVIDFSSILQYLRKRGYDRTMTLEMQPQFLNRGKKVLESIWYEQSIGGQETAS
jgi:sugar phosphate isomerase/epimerase